METQKAAIRGKKQPDFSERENAAIISAVAERYSVITQGTKTADANTKKRKAWADITHLVNAVGGYGREPKSVMKRWKDMRDNVKRKPALARRTGGGPPDPPVAYEESILAILKDSKTLDGVVGEDGDTYTTHNMEGSYIQCDESLEHANTHEINTKVTEASDPGQLLNGTVIYNYAVPVRGDRTVIIPLHTTATVEVGEDPTEDCETRPVLSSTPNKTTIHVPDGKQACSSFGESATWQSKKSCHQQQSKTDRHVRHAGQESLWDEYLKQEIEKKKIEMTLLKNKNIKTEMEIELLKIKMAQKGIEQSVIDKITLGKDSQ